MGSHELSLAEENRLYQQRQDERMAKWAQSAQGLFPPELITNPSALRAAYRTQDQRDEPFTELQINVALRHPHIEVTETIARSTILNPNQLAYVIDRFDRLNKVLLGKNAKPYIPPGQIEQAQRNLGNSKEVIDTALGYAGILRLQMSQGT